jgi:hypothetical protein
LTILSGLSESDFFQKGINRLEKGIKQFKVVLMRGLVAFWHFILRAATNNLV